MSTAESNEAYKIIREGHVKYIYFILAVSASAIAFAIQKTEHSVLTKSMIPLGLSILSWGLSFYYGCKNLKYLQVFSMANQHLLLMEDGNLPHNGYSTIDQARSIMKMSSDKMNKFWRRQTNLLIIGALCFIAWHLVEMIKRSL